MSKRYTDEEFQKLLEAHNKYLVYYNERGNKSLLDDVLSFYTHPLTKPNHAKMSVKIEQKHLSFAGGNSE